MLKIGVKKIEWKGLCLSKRQCKRLRKRLRKFNALS